MQYSDEHLWSDAQFCKHLGGVSPATRQGGLLSQASLEAVRPVGCESEQEIALLSIYHW